MAGQDLLALRREVVGLAVDLERETLMLAERLETLLGALRAIADIESALLATPYFIEFE